MITVKIDIAQDEGCWFVQNSDEINLICWSDSEQDLRRQATEAIIFTLAERNIKTSQIACEFSVVPFCASEMA